MITNKNTTSILAAVQSMHAQQDAGYDPYDSARVPVLTLGQFTEMQRREAEANLACYETKLTLVRT